jgi:uncharacterized repeat protein (TIGR03803 family)
MTYEGGLNGDGVIFSYNPATSTYTDVFNLTTATGSYPYGSLMQATNGNLYGMTEYGGTNSDGVIFSYNPATSTYTDVFNLTTDTGSYPEGSLMQATNGNLYGMTLQGGTNNYGVIFSYNPNAYTYNWYLNSVSTGTATQTYSPGNLSANATIYCAVSSGTCGPVSSNTSTVTVAGTLFTPGTVGASQAICYNSIPAAFTSITLPTGGTFSYQWQSSADGVNFNNISGATLTTYTVATALTTTTYYRRAETLSNCATQYSNVITVNVPGTLYAGISGGGSPICYNTTPTPLTATATGGTGTYTYQWYNGTNIISGQTGSTYTPASGLTSAATYNCSVTSGSCGETFTGTTIIVYASLTAAISGGTSPICPNSSPGTYTATATGGAGAGTGTYTDLVNYTGTSGAAEGEYPVYWQLCQAGNGLLYGMTERGGLNGDGVIFSYNPATSTYTDVFNLTTATGY